MPDLNSALFALCTGLIASVLALAGVGMASAGLADQQTRAFLADWEAKATAPSARAWEVAFAAATRAVAHYPVAHGAYLERLGYVHAWQHFGQASGAPGAQLSRQAARDAYRAAVQARPHWPYAWAALARVKLDLLEFDAEFHRALSEAQRLGPWRTDINRRVAEVGLSAWPQLAGAQRALTLDAAVRAMSQGRSHRAPLLALAHYAGQSAALCARLHTQGLRPSASECPPPAAAARPGAAARRAPRS